MINILTRTSERPFEFERLYKSIKGQKNNTLRYRHIVCYENDEDLTYKLCIKQFGLLTFNIKLSDKYFSYISLLSVLK